MINGKNYSWEDISIVLPHGTLIHVLSIEYSDEKEAEPLYGAGSNPVGYGQGNYKAEGKLTLRREEFDLLIEYAKKQGTTLYGLGPFPIVVSYANDDEPRRTDTLPMCKFTKTSTSPSQGDKEVKIDLDFQCFAPIKWNDMEAN